MENRRIDFFRKVILCFIFLLAAGFAAAPAGPKDNYYAYSSGEVAITELFSKYITEAAVRPVLLDNELSAAALAYNKFIRAYGEKYVSDRAANYVFNKQGIYDFVVPVVVSKKRRVATERLLSQKIKNYLSNGSFNAYGVSVISEGDRETIVLLFARRYLQLDKLSLANYTGQLKLSGKLLSKFFNLRLFVLSPDKKVEEYQLRDEQAVFEFPYIFKNNSGKYIFQIVGDDVYGTLTLALFPVYHSWPVESEKQMIEQINPTFNNYSRFEAEDSLLKDLETIRQYKGLPPLHYNSVLAQAAAAHSTDMAVNSFFSQGSYTEQQTVKQLLDATSLEYSGFGVNIVMGRSLPEIIDNLNTLPYNRQNRLSPDHSDYGIGIAVESNEDGMTNYYVTEIFLKKKDTKFYTAQKEQLLMLINEKRNFRKLQPLGYAEKFNDYAQKHAQDMAELDTLSYVVADGKNIGEQYRGIQGIRSSIVKVFAAQDLKNIESADLYDPQYNKISIGYAVGDSSRYGPNTNWVVLVFLQE